MAEFFRQLIPVSVPLWIFFFLLPYTAALVWQAYLCFHAKKTRTKFLPLIIAACIPIVVYACHFLNILQTVLGGFVGLLLLGTALFIAGGSAVGWMAYGIAMLCRKKQQKKTDG